MIPRNPCEDMPSCESETCDLGDCGEPWAEEVEVPNGPRMMRLCEDHATRWLQAERELDAELEEVAGRTMASRRARPGTAAAIARAYGAKRAS